MDKSPIKFSKVLFITLLIFAPLAFGSCRVWAESILELMACAIFMLLLFEALVKKTSFMLKHLWFLFFLCCLLFIQTVPLSESLLAYLSPAAFKLSHGTGNSSISVYPFATFNKFLLFFAFAFVFIYARGELRQFKQIKRIFSVLVFFGFAVSIFAILQRISWNGKIFWLFSEINVRSIPMGPYINQNHFAGLMEMLAPLALGMFLIEKSKEKRFLFGTAFVTMAASIYFSLSRGGAISFTLALVAMFVCFSCRKIFRKNIWIVFSVLTSLVAVLLWVGITPLLERFGLLKDPIHVVRPELFRSTFELIKNYPLFGSGAGTFQYVFEGYKSISRDILFVHAHNDYLEFFSELGLIGMVPVLAALFVACFMILKRIFSTRDNHIFILTIAGFGGILSILFHSFTDFNLQVPANALFFVTIMALTMNIAEYRGDQNAYAGLWKNRINGKRGILIFGLVCVVLGVFYLRPVILNFLSDYEYRKSARITDNAEKKARELSPFEFNKSKSALEKAIELRPGNAKYYYELARLLMVEERDKENGLEISEKLAEKLGVNAEDGKEIVPALFKKAIRLNPANSRHWFFNAVFAGREFLGGSKEFSAEEVRCYFEEAIKRYPSKGEYRCAFAKWAIYAARFTPDRKKRTELFQLAVDHYREATAYESFIAQEAMEELIKITENYAVLEKAVSNKVEDKAFIIGKALVDNASWEENKAAFLKDMSRSENKFPYYKAIAYSHAFLRDYRSEIEVLREYLKDNPYDAKAYFYTAELAYARRGLVAWPYIKSLYQKAVQMDPENESYLTTLRARLNFMEGKSADF